MKVAVLGCGQNGQTKVRQLQESELVDTIVVYDQIPDRATATASLYDVESAGQLHDILADDSVKLVLISTTNDAHASLTIAALEAGKAVLCEKPMATSMSDAVAMVDTAERTSGFLQVGFELRYSTLYTTVKNWIDQGLLGDVVNTHCLYISSEYFGPDSWRVKKQASGDMFAEKLSHYVDLPRWWIGSEVSEVFSVTSPNVVPYYEVHDNYHTVYKFRNGAVSQLTFMIGPAATFRGDPLQDKVGQQHRDGHELRFIISGTKGSAQTDVFGRSLKRWEFSEGNDGLLCELAEEHTWTGDRDHEHFHNTRDQTLDVVRRVAEGRDPSIDPRDALRTTALCIAAEDSANTGKPVQLT